VLAVNKSGFSMRLEILSPVAHANLRIRPSSAAVPHFVQIVAPEFVVAAASCPVFFTKDASTGEFYAGAMLGFKPGEPLKQTAAERGGFDPLNLVRDGFFISEERIAIDMENPRFSTSVGDPLFDEEGQPSVRLRQIQRVLGQLHEGQERTQRMIEALMKLKLIELIDISLKFDSGEQLSLQGLYTVTLDALHAVGDADVLQLFRSGYLQLIYAMNLSMNQIGALAQLRNQQALQSPLPV
jgi:hypothetical protein